MHQFRQEFQLNSRGDDQLHWTTGAFYSNLKSGWFDYGQSHFVPGFDTPGHPHAAYTAFLTSPAGAQVAPGVAYCACA